MSALWCITPFEPGLREDYALIHLGSEILSGCVILTCYTVRSASLKVARCVMEVAGAWGPAEGVKNTHSATESHL